MLKRTHHVKGPMGELKQFRKECDDNKRRAQAMLAAKQQRERTAALKREQDARAHELQMKQQHTILAKKLTEQQFSRSKMIPASRKRPLPRISPKTSAVCYAIKRQTVCFTRCRSLSQSDTGRECFDTTALRDGTCTPLPMASHMTEAAIRDGLTIVPVGDSYGTEGLKECKWYRCSAWRELACKVLLLTRKTDKVYLPTSTNIGINVIGSGTFNAVLTFGNMSRPSTLPSWVPKDCAIRMTRTDNYPDGNYKYQTLQSVAKEAEYAMFFAQNDIGVKIFAVAGFEGVRQQRTLRYGAMYAMQQASMDLYRTLHHADVFENGCKIGMNVTELLFRASRCGVAFFDVKPGNILRVEDNAGNQCFRMTDFDPHYFFVATQYDWRILLLINLSLLSCHVRNGQFGEVGVGWATAVGPLLRELLAKCKCLDCEWLFEVRPVCVDFDYTDNVNNFTMGKMLAIMATSYFYGTRLENNVRSASWAWEHKVHQAELNAWWEMPQRRSSWPPAWGRRNSPPTRTLIDQLVHFATERDRHVT